MLSDDVARDGGQDKPGGGIGSQVQQSDHTYGER